MGVGGMGGIQENKAQEGNEAGFEVLRKAEALPAGPTKQRVFVLHTEPVTCMGSACRVNLNLRCYLVRGPPPQTVGFKVIDPQDLDSPFDTEMM